MTPTPNRTVAQIMSRHPVTVAAEAALGQVAEIMESGRISSVLVEEAGRFVGIVTERDVMRALGQGISPTAAVSAVMSRGLVSVRQSEEVHAAFHVMVAQNIRHLVVVDEAGLPVGIISETDFRKQRGVEDFIGVVTVVQTMSQSYLPASGSESVLETARRMQERKLGCAVVLERNVPRGLVTERDMVRLFRMQAGESQLAQVMTSPVTTVAAGAPLEEAVKLMQERRIRRLVVIDDAGGIVGVLNEHDIVRHLEDEYVQMLQQMVVQQARELNDNMFKAVINNLPTKILVKDVESRYIACNESYSRDLHIRPDDIVGMTDYDFFPTELAERYRADDLKVVTGGITLSMEEPYFLDAKEMWIHTVKAPMRDAQGRITGVVASFHDITEYKQNALDLQRRTWALEALSRSDKAMVFASTDEAMLQDICQSIVNLETYPLAWVGWAEHDAEKTVRVAAAAGKAMAYLDNIKVSWADAQFGQGPTGQAIRHGRTVINRDPKNNPGFAPWLERALGYGIQASVSVPLLMEGKVVGALMVYANDPMAFGAHEVKLFEELSNTMGYGLVARQTQRNYEHSLREREQQAQKLDLALEGALQAVAATLEQRDPYTAGHQKNVAVLATQIGRQMGLDNDRLRGLHLASIVHDLGKIQIPAEILTKPGRLSPIEFALIKAHPEVGYNILKNIEFPWPIAQIIRQHHEYLDGSGYPHGLTAEQILPEAKILTVADIVESMSSDRPYRAALGLAEAITEITKLRGTRLDAAAVDACVAILQRGDYVPSTANYLG